jgi:ribosomal protein S18 acetylase RimI-like enzyme
VLPEKQGLGIGQQLVKAIEERFRQRGVSQILIMVNQDNQDVIPFYHSLGYETQKFVTLSKMLSS